MPVVYAWKIKEGLCHWGEHSKSDLLVYDPPSPEAKVVKCFMMEYRDYLKLKKINEE